MASYYGVGFSPSLWIRLEIATCWEMIQKQKSQPCPRVGRWTVGCGNDWLIFIHSLQKTGVSKVPFSYPPLAQQDHSASGDFQAANHWFRGFRFPKASLDLGIKISTAALHSSIAENPLCAPAHCWHLGPGSWEGWAPEPCGEVVTLWEESDAWDPPSMGVTGYLCFSSNDTYRLLCLLLPHWLCKIEPFGISKHTVDIECLSLLTFLQIR